MSYHITTKNVVFHVGYASIFYSHHHVGGERKKKTMVIKTSVIHVREVWKWTKGNMMKVTMKVEAKLDQHPC